MAKDWSHQAGDIEFDTDPEIIKLFGHLEEHITYRRPVKVPYLRYSSSPLSNDSHCFEDIMDFFQPAYCPSSHCPTTFSPAPTPQMLGDIAYYDTNSITAMFPLLNSPSQSPPFSSCSSLVPSDGSGSRSLSLSDIKQEPSLEQEAPKRRRRPGSSTSDPIVERQLFLEKNRKAASKCRSKQKKQQDRLVEKARDEEKRNKILKAEVEILAGDVGVLMSLIGQHDGCADSGMKDYVEREIRPLECGGLEGISGAFVDSSSSSSSQD